MKEFFISDDIKRDCAGVYMIVFPSEHYYIGSSTNVYVRVKAHISFFKSLNSDNGNRVGDPLMLNNPRTTGNSCSLGVNVKKHVSSKIKEIAKEKGLKLSEYVESLFTEAIKEYDIKTGPKP